MHTDCVNSLAFICVLSNGLLLNLVNKSEMTLIPLNLAHSGTVSEQEKKGPIMLSRDHMK